MHDVELAPTPKNDPRLLRLVRVKVIVPFCLGGQPLSVGAQVEIPFHLAQDLRAIGKIHFLVD